MSIAARSRRHRRGVRRRRLYSALLALVAGAGWWFSGSGDLQPRFAAGADPTPFAAGADPARFAAGVDPISVAVEVAQPVVAVPVTRTAVDSIDEWDSVDQHRADRPTVEPVPAAGVAPPTAPRSHVAGSAGLTRAPPRA